MMEIPAQLANESIALPRGHRSPRLHLGDRIWARLTGPSLDVRIAAGEDPSRDALLSCRARHLLSDRTRDRLVGGLERALAPPRDRAVFSAAIACNRPAVEVARPILEQLSEALGSRDGVDPRGVVLTQALLTDPASPLYHPAELDELDEVARQALLALAPAPTPPRWPQRGGRSHARASREQPERGSRSPL